jgi:alkanesulfonate monooxygenase SsuD/methylene tetrahydromethanopterin reductase-like flavin-dependent oxidoreductase (luciferase family)
MTQATWRIGIVPTFGTYSHHPYLLARLIASLDQVSSGRIGWNAVTGSSDFAAMNYGLPGLPEHDLRYEMADEYMAAVRAVGIVGTGRDRRRPDERRLYRPGEGPPRQFRRSLVQIARPARWRRGWARRWKRSAATDTCSRCPMSAAA